MSGCSSLQTQVIGQTLATTYTFQVTRADNNYTSRVIFAKNLPQFEYAILIAETNTQDDFTQAGTVLYDPGLGFELLSERGGYSITTSVPTEIGFFRSLRIQSPPPSSNGSRANWTFTAVTETSVQGQMCIITSGLGGPLPIGGDPVLPGCPSITGMAYPSPDGQQICQLDYKINIPAEICPLCPNAKQPCYGIEKSYKQYCLNLSSVIDIANVNDDTVGVYASLRLILSQIVFGDFNVQYLRQCYYNKLICKLQSTAFCNFAQRLEQEYRGYELLFKKC